MIERLEWFDHRNPDYKRVFQTRYDRMLRIRAAGPGAIALLKRFYADNPVQFLYDWGITHDPRNLEMNMPAMVPFLMFDRQIEFCEYVLRKWRESKPGLVEKSRDVGASWLCMALACTLCLFNHDFVVGFGSRKQEYVDSLGDPKSLFFKARSFVRLLPREFRGGWREKDAPFMRLMFRDTNSVITGESGDNIGRGGRTSLYFVDEAAHLERPELVDAALSANTNCRVDLSSVKGMANPFAIKRFGGKIEVFTFHWRSDPRKDDAWYKSLTEDRGLSAKVIAQEFDIDYSASVEGVVIPSAWVQAAVNAHEKLGLVISGSQRAALDVADEGEDLNALAARHGVLLNRIKSWSGVGGDLYKTTAKAMQHLDEWGHTSYDYDGDGLGSGVRGNANALNEKRLTNPVRATPWRGSSAVREPERKNMAPPLKNEDVFQNRKAQEWWALRLRFERTFRWVVHGVPCDPDEIISIDPKLPELAAVCVELSQPTYDTNGAGKILIEKKPEGTKSPNLADAIMMAYAKGTSAGMNISNQLMGRK